MSSIFKIRRKSDGKFSRGGAEPKFVKNGKTWGRRADIDKHLVKVYQEYNSNRAYDDDCEVVEYELVEFEKNAQPLGRFMSEAEKRFE